MDDDILKMVFSFKPEGRYNPLFWRNIGDMWIMACLFQGITAYNEELKLVGRLAKIITHTTDYKIWTIELLDNLYWSDGVKLTAEDIEFTFKTMFNQLYNGVRSINKIVGSDEYRSGAYNEISGIKVISELKIQIELVSSDKTFMNKLLQPPIPKHIFDGWPIDRLLEHPAIKNPIGCGAYRLLNYDEKIFNFGRYDNFHLGCPKISRLTIEFTSSANVLEMLKNKKADFAILNPKESKQIELCTHLQLFKLPQPYYEAIGINHNHPLLKFKKFRKSLMYAINRKNILESVYCGYGEIINQHYPELLKQYRADNLQAYEYDPNLAASLLHELGLYKDENGKWNFKGVQVNLKLSVLSSEITQVETAKLIKDNLSSFGINLEVINYDKIDDFRKSINDLDSQLWIRGFNTSLSSDASIIFGKNSSWRAKLAWKNLLSEEYLEKGLSTADEIEQSNIYRDWSLIVNDELPMLFLISPYDLQIVNKRIKGLRPDPRGVLWNIHEAYFQ